MDLNEPLGFRPPTKPRRRVAGLLAVSAVGIALAGVGVFLATADPRGGEPYAVAPVPPPAPISVAGDARAPTDPTPTGSIAGASDPTRLPPIARTAGSLESGVTVYRGGAQSTPQGVPTPSATGPLIIDVSRSLDGPKRKAAPDAASTSMAAATPGSPRVAIFVSGMGLSQSATRAATERMPAAVDLAFVPYGETVGAAVEAAKAKGHEILLDVPMQTGTSQPLGPHAVSAGEPPQKLAEDIAWLMDRVPGYVGVANLLGGTVTSDAATMTPLLRAVASRGLFFVDDGTSARSVVASLAPGLGLTALQADVVLDATSDPAVVRANLDRLVATAKRKGQAIGMASGLPDHVGEIARFAGDLGAQGVTLVPVSALVGRPGGIASSR